MRFFSLALFLLSLLTTASAVRNYNFEIHLVNQNAPNNACTAAEFEDFSNQLLPTVSAVLSDPKYDLRVTAASEWKKTGPSSTPANRALSFWTGMSCAYCMSQPGAYTYLCYDFYSCASRRMLRSERGLSDADIIEIKTVTEGAMHGLINKLANTSPYSATCTKSLLGAVTGTSLTIL